MRVISKETQEDIVSTNDVLKAQFRDKAAPVKKMRRDGWVPGVVYGKGFDGIDIMVPKMSLSKFFHHSGKVFEVEVEGHGKHLVTLDDVQRGNLGTDYIHFSFHKVSAKEKTTVTLPIHFIGEAKGTKEGGVVYPVLHEVEVRGLPKDFPEFIEVDVTELEMNGHWTLGDIKPPRGIEWAHALEDNMVTCHAPRVKVVEEPAAEVEAPEAHGDITPVETEEKEAA
ncbi:ribosomal protein L25, Ctc-form [Bacteriovorax sp. DB6_IX]|nr:ribosomal protein L25, Ctc-form [Bacteriovorax sp. DB6_IX]